MPPALLDTNAVSDLMRDHPQLTVRVANYPDPITTSVIVLGEIRHGLSRLPAGKKRTDLEARAQNVFANVVMEPVLAPIADAFGQLKASLEAQGLSMNDNDLWIAATALALGSVLVTRDQDFGRIAGLRVEDWSA